MGAGTGRSLALLLAAVGLASPAGAQTATAGVAAEVVAPVEPARAAAEWLLSTSPGTYTLRIPGAATISVALQAPHPGKAVIDFLNPSQGADTLRSLLAQFSPATAARSTRHLARPTALAVLNSHGVQLILVSLEQQGDGGGVLRAIIAFD